MSFFPLFPSNSVPTLPTRVHCTPTAARLVLKPTVPHKNMTYLFLNYLLDKVFPH